MKKFLLIPFVSLLMFSCKKENTFEAHKTSHFSNIIAGLKDSLSEVDFANINLEKATITKIKRNSSYIKIPFNGKDISKDFILIQIDDSGEISRGFIINLLRDNVEKGREYAFNGFITKSSLDRKVNNTSLLTNGVITHSQSARVAHREMDESFPVPKDKDTTIIITTENVPPFGDAPVTFSDWISIQGLFNYSGYYGADGGYLLAGYYNSNGSAGSTAVGEQYGSGGYSGDTFQLAPVLDLSNVVFQEKNPLFVDFEPNENLLRIDVTSFLKCFANIPDEGSTCSIEILTDIPVDNDPNKLFNWQTRSVGHTFLQFHKTNGNLSVMQNIGFYPMDDWKTILTTAPVASKIVDNGQHEFNANLEMHLTPEEFKRTLDEMVRLAQFAKYDIDEFNCTDFALDIFNSTRISNPLEIPKYDIPGGIAPNGSNTPEGLYNELKHMQQQGIESNNITIPGVKGWVANSDGPCN